MSDGTLPTAPPPPPASPNPLPPQAAPGGVRQSHVGLVLGVIVALYLVIHMFSGSSSSGSSDNPLIGNWTLADTDKGYCGTHEQFKSDSAIEVKAGVTTTYPAIYLVKPGYVDVSEGNVANYEQWDETGPDEVTFRLNSLYVVASCKYHRD